MLDIDAANKYRLAPGTRLGGIYEIDRRIASGGMGDIYRGHAIETGAQVAIKVIRTDLADNETALALFRREAVALNDIHHEAIVRYYVFANDPGTGRYYLAMEFVDGQPLSDILHDGPLGFEAVLLLQRRLAAGLHAAHKHGIVHRDVSPDNVLVPGRDCSLAKIIDFGIARDTRLGERTIIGSGFAGKYNYVSPEQLGLYGEVTPKSDIYSLGLVLAQALTGQPIDMGGSQADVLEKRRVVPDLRTIDARFRPLIERMLQPNPGDRPESMAAVAAWVPGYDISAPGRLASAPRDRARPAASRAQTVTGLNPFRRWQPSRTILAILLLVGAGGAGFYILKEQVSHPPVPLPSGASVLIPADTGDQLRPARPKELPATSTATLSAPVVASPVAPSVQAPQVAIAPSPKVPTEESAPVSVSAKDSSSKENAQIVLAPPQSTLGPEAPARRLSEEQIVRERIKKAQKELIRLGCYDGGPDGSLNGATRDAVRKFWDKTKQRIGEVEITPELITQLEQHLDSLCEEAPLPKPTPQGPASDKKNERPRHESLPQHPPVQATKPPPPPVASKPANRTPPAAPANHATTHGNVLTGVQ